MRHCCLLDGGNTAIVEDGVLMGRNSAREQHIYDATSPSHGPSAAISRRLIGYDIWSKLTWNRMRVGHYQDAAEFWNFAMDAFEEDELLRPLRDLSTYTETNTKVCRVYPESIGDVE